METCSFFTNDRQAVSEIGCSTHGRHPVDCVRALEAENAELRAVKGSAHKLFDAACGASVTGLLNVYCICDGQNGIGWDDPDEKHLGECRDLRIAIREFSQAKRD